MPKDTPPAPEAPGDPAATDAGGEPGGAVKPWRDEAPDPKRTKKVAKEAAQLAEQHVEDDQDKAAAEAPRDVLDAAGMRVAIGVDVGGSGIKAAAVNLDTGELISPRHRVPTPQPSAPAAVIASIARMIKKITAEVTLDPTVAGRGGLPRGRHRRGDEERRERRPGLGRLRRRQRARARPRPAGPPRERRGRRRRGGDALRGRDGPAGNGVPDHARHGHGLGAVLRRDARPEPRARPHGDPRPGCRATVRRRVPPPSGAQLEGVGDGPRRAPAGDREAVQPQAVHHRWRRLEALGAVHPAADGPRGGRARQAAQRRRHRRGGDRGGRAGARAAAAGARSRDRGRRPIVPCPRASSDPDHGGTCRPCPT